MSRTRGRCPHDSARRPDRGQAVVETALVLPVIAIMLLGVAQVVTVAVHQIAIVHAARDAVRAAAVSADPGGAARAALDRFDPTITANVTSTDGVVTVTLSRRDPTDVPLIGRLLPDVELEARASMALEPP